MHVFDDFSLVSVLAFVVFVVVAGCAFHLCVCGISFLHISFALADKSTQIHTYVPFIVVCERVFVCAALFVKCLSPLLCQLFLCGALSYAFYCHFSAIESGNIFAAVARHSLPRRAHHFFQLFAQK